MVQKNRISGDLKGGSNSTILEKRVTYNWRSLGEKVNSHAAKAYGIYYIRDVALGYRKNRKVTDILNALGVLKELRRGIA